MNHTILSRKPYWCIGVVTRVIRQYAFNICLWQIFWVEGEKTNEKRGVTTEGWSSFIFMMTHIDSIIKKIQLLSSVSN